MCLALTFGGDQWWQIFSKQCPQQNQSKNVATLSVCVDWCKDVLSSALEILSYWVILYNRVRWGWIEQWLVSPESLLVKIGRLFGWVWFGSWELSCLMMIGRRRFNLLQILCWLLRLHSHLLQCLQKIWLCIGLSAFDGWFYLVSVRLFSVKNWENAKILASLNKQNSFHIIFSCFGFLWYFMSFIRYFFYSLSKCWAICPESEWIVG